MTNTGRLPDFIAVGSIKCGTTSLHYYFSLHPEIHVSHPKELHFFVGEKQQEKKIPQIQSTTGWGNWGKGIDWYRRHFLTSRKVCGEISPGYVDRDWIQIVVGRMRQFVPGAKVLLLVRQPMDRLWSHYMMLRMQASIRPVSFDEFVLDPDYSRYRYYSWYGSQLKVLLQHYPSESIKIVETAALEKMREETLRDVFKFLGVDPAFRSEGFKKQMFEGKNRRFPSETGTRILKSPLMRWAENHLPFTVYEKARNLVLIPFSTDHPHRKLPADLEKELNLEFQREVTLLRQLSGLPLVSLEVGS